jgi:hypothetical protein
MDKFKEYRLFSERNQRLSERRQTASQTYLAVNTAVFGVLAFLVDDVGFRGWGLMVVSLPLFLVGVLTCLIWHKIIAQFKQVIGWHYEQLRDMEQALPDSHKIYSNEWEEFFKPRQGKERFGFSRLEIWLPRLLLGLYFVYGVGLIVATAFGWL